MTRERLMLLAREALQQRAASLSGAWAACPSIDDYQPRGSWEIHTELPAWDGFHDLGVMLQQDAKLIAAAHDREPLLARAVLALLAWAQHKPTCESNDPVDIYEDPQRFLPCTCGLDAALEIGA